MPPRPSLISLPEAPRVTVVEVTYPAHRGRIGVRGNRAPLSWEETTAPTLNEGDRWVFHLEVPPHEVLELKLVRNDEDWANGRNYAVHAGDHLWLEPHFDGEGGQLEPPQSLDVDGTELRYEVLLPPSYREQEGKRYPVLYAQDGQALWSTSTDPFGIWSLDATLSDLYALGAMEEVIVVGIDTSARRMERLSPVPDGAHGGGEGKGHLAAIVDHLRPRINRDYRTRPEREHTAVMGSSMGGLFSFFAAWARPEVFGKAACLSSSFWWADRHLIRLVQSSAAREPRPVFYLDSGAARSPLVADANQRDGYHHTRSMARALSLHGYTPGVDVHRLSFPGSTHDAPSWAARVAIPLQLLFPPAYRAPDEVAAAAAPPACHPGLGGAHIAG
jgi:predicted alpha/beta superfamily hydrolase